MTISLSQWEAFMIETLRHNGVNGEQLIKGLKEDDVDQFKAYDTTFDYQDLLTSWRDDSERITEAIFNGYQVKFLSVYGIKRLLKLMFSIEESEDYILEERRFVDITLTDQQFKTVQELLSPNWFITNSIEKNHKHVITITHSTAIES